MDLLRVTVKVPGKRLHRAATPSGPSPGPVLVPVPGVNGVSKDKQTSEGGATCECQPLKNKKKILLIIISHHHSFAISVHS